jgi:integrase
MSTLPKYLTQDELQRFFKVISSPRDRALFAVIYHYDLRVDEAAALTVDDLDLKNHRIRIRRLKNGIGGEKPVWRHTAKLLRAYLRVRRNVHIPPYYVVDRCAADSESSSHCGFLLRHHVWARLRRQTGQEITPTISMAWYLPRNPVKFGVHRFQRRFFLLECTEHRVGTDMQRARRITHPTGIETHVDDHLLDLRQAAAVTIVEQKTALGTQGILA